MERIDRWKWIVGALLIAALSGCANLEAVREYARQSSELAGYAELTERFRDTYERERPYLFGEAEARAEELDRRREAVYDDLLRLHTVVAIYMRALGELAGEEAFSLSESAKSLLQPLAAAPELGIDAALAEKYGELVRLITDWVTSVRQRTAVKEMIVRGNEPVQAVLGGMERLVTIYERTHENERKLVTGLLSTELALADPANQRLLVALGRAHEQRLRNEYDAAERRYEPVRTAIRTAAEGHRTLFDNVNRLSARRAVEEIQRISKELKKIRKAWKALSE